MQEINKDFDGPDILVFAGDDDDIFTAKSVSVIDDLQYAMVKYTAKYLFILNECKQMAEDDLRYVTRDEFLARRKIAADKFKNMTEDHVALWEMRRRSHLEQQPSIARRIVKCLR